MMSGPYRSEPRYPVHERLPQSRAGDAVSRAGQPQAAFVVERVLDLVAREPAATRADVPRESGDAGRDAVLTSACHYRAAHTVVYDSGDYPGTLRRALETSGYPQIRARCAAARATGRLRGVGVACYVEMTGPGPYEGATVRIDPAGRISVFTGITSQGQGHETSFAQICASELGVTPDDVTLSAGDTLTINHGIGTFASRGAVMGGAAIALATRELRTRALGVAARLLGAAPGDVEQRGTVFATADGGRQVSFAQVATAAAVPAPGTDPGLEVTRYYQPEGGPYSHGAHVVEVEGRSRHRAQVAIIGYWVSHDCGRIVNPLIVDGQIVGGIAMGIGNALLEEIVYNEEDSRSRARSWTTSCSLRRRAAHRARSLRDAVADQSARGQGGGGVRRHSRRGRVASAVEDALGRHGVVVREVPLSPRRIDELLHGHLA